MSQPHEEGRGGPGLRARGGAFEDVEAHNRGVGARQLGLGPLGGVQGPVALHVCKLHAHLRVQHLLQSRTSPS